jgi:hypothetical protein
MLSKSRIARTAPLAAIIALMAVPALSQAQSVTFGTRLDHEPSNSAPGHNCNEDGNEDITPICTRVAVDKSDAVPAGLRAPKSGTIIKFNVRAGAPGELTFRLARLKHFGFDTTLNDYSALGQGAGTGPHVHVKGNGFRDPDEGEGNPIESFKANLKVTKGDYLAIDSATNSTQYCASGGAKQMIFTPKLGKKNGTFKKNTTKGGCDLLVQAVMKPAKKH